MDAKTGSDTDRLVELIKEEERSTVRPQFKAFLGMCAGVGKTHAMLQDARALRAQGIEVLVAVVDTHGQAETEALLEGLETLSRGESGYGPSHAGELDVDAIVERKPAIVVVDDLAHTNRSGSRHAKRWQDVIELLDRGIPVWTSVNIQHMESLAEVVEDLTGVGIPDRVPDSVFDRIDDLRLIDLDPDDLLDRLKAGKVFVPGIPNLTVEGFFNRRNLGALRELSLRYAAGKAERNLTAYVRAENGSPPRPALGGRILVAVGPSPSSAHLIRWARRTAYALRADWTAVHVDSGAELSAPELSRLEANLDLARRLGAETQVIQGLDIAATILEAARSRNVSMIVIGRSGLSSRNSLPGRLTVSDRIVRDAGPIDVTVVQDAATTPSAAGPGPRISLPTWPRPYFVLIAAFLAVTAVGKAVVPVFGYRSIAFMYLAVVLVLSFFTSPAAVAGFAVLSALTFNFLFIPPLFTFTIGTPEDWILFAVYFLVAFVTGSLVSRLKASERMVTERERRTDFLFNAAEQLAECSTIAEAAAVAVGMVEKHFAPGAVVYVDSGTGRPGERPYGESSAHSSVEFEAATYAWTSGTICGRATGSMSGCALRYFPASAGGKTAAVIGVRVPEGKTWTRGDDDLVLSLGHTLALTISRAAVEAKSRRIARELESDRLARVLLDSVSHELRTPLTTIVGSVSALGDDLLAGNPAARHDLLAGALGAAERLNRIVEDLLSISRIEAGMLRLKREPSDIQEIARASMDQAGPEIKAHPIRVMIENDAASPELDVALATKLAANLLRNAGQYSPAGTEIAFGFEISGKDLVITVRDHGPGIPDGQMASLFGKFRRGAAAPGRGLGLGLAICRGIAEAHGGTIAARNAQDGGLEITVVFPDCIKGKE